jgi:hypothetical protein
LSTDVNDLQKRLKATQTELAALQTDVSKVAAEVSKQHGKHDKSQDYSAILSDILEKQKILLKSLNESAMEHLLHNINVFLTHFKQGCVHYAQETWAFIIDVGRFVTTVSNDVANKGVAGIEAEIRAFSSHAKDLIVQTHAHFVQLLSQQQLISHEHDITLAWVMLSITIFVVTLVTLQLLKTLCCCLCPCCPRGKRRRHAAAATEDGERHSPSTGTTSTSAAKKAGGAAKKQK